MRLQGFLRLHVDVRPLRVVGAGFDHGQVEGTVFLAYLLEALEITGIAAEKDPRSARFDDPRRPQGRVAVEWRAAGKMLGRRGHQLDAADLGRLPPVQLAHLAGRDTPGDEPV